MSEFEVPEPLRKDVSFTDRGFLDPALYKVDTIPLSEISRDKQFQPRVDGLDEAHLSRLVEVLPVDSSNAGEDCFGSVDQLPLVAILDNTSGPVIVSGFHRVEAYRKRGYERALFRVLKSREPNIASLDLISVRENSHESSPMKLSKRDRRAKIEKMLENPQFSGLSNLALSKIFGISDKTVGSIREALGVKPDEITTSDGKTRSSGRKSTKPETETETETDKGRISQLEQVVEGLKTSLERRFIVSRATSAALLAAGNDSSIKIKDLRRIMIKFGEALASLDKDRDEAEIGSELGIESIEIEDLPVEPTVVPLSPIESVLMKIRTAPEGSSLNLIMNKNWKSISMKLSEDELEEVRRECESHGVSFPKARDRKSKIDS